MFLSNHCRGGPAVNCEETSKTASEVVCYSELAKKMAMKIGGEYGSNNVQPQHFEKLAEEAGLSKALVKQRVRQLEESVFSALDSAKNAHPVTVAVAKSSRTFVRER